MPEDSKFCPDCGTPIKNEEELRRQAKEIVTTYSKGYDYFVKYQSFPHFAYNLTAENCEKIIAKKLDIIKKHNEIIQEEKRIKEAKEFEDKRCEVSQIQSTYSKGYYFYAQQNIIPYYGQLSSIDCDRVIANKYKIIQKHNEIVAEEEKTKRQKIESLWEEKKYEILFKNNTYFKLYDKKQQTFPYKFYGISIIFCFIIGFLYGFKERQDVAIGVICGIVGCILSPLSLLLYFLFTGNNPYGINKRLSDPEEILMADIEREEKRKWINSHL